MREKYFKNDYHFLKDAKDFFNTNSMARGIKPYLKGIYHRTEMYLPSPRQFLLAKAKKGGVYCEIGVWNGDYSERIVRRCRPSKLYLIDPWQAIPGQAEPKYAQPAQDARYARVTNRLAPEIAAGRVIILRKTSDEAMSGVPDESLDFLYIDGSHETDQVAKDLRNYFPKVKRGGILSGDDYHFEGVRAAVDEFAAEIGRVFEVRDRQYFLTK